MKEFNFKSSVLMKLPAQKNKGIPSKKVEGFIGKQNINVAPIAFGKPLWTIKNQGEKEKIIIAEIFDYDYNSKNFKISVFNISKREIEDCQAVLVGYRMVYRLMFHLKSVNLNVKFSVGNYLYQVIHYSNHNKTHLIRFAETNSSRCLLIEKV